MVSNHMSTTRIEGELSYGLYRWYFDWTLAGEEIFRVGMGRRYCGLGRRGDVLTRVGHER